EGHAGVSRVRERTLPFDDQQLSPTAGAFDDEAFRRASQEVRDDCIDRDAPARDRDSRLAGRDEPRLEAARPGLAVELNGDRLLADRAVGADGQDGLRVEPEVLAGGNAEVGRRFPQIAELDALLL